MFPESPAVPWTGRDVLLFFALWYAAQIMCGLVGDFADSRWQPVPSAAETNMKKTDNHDHGHPLAQMIVHAKNAPLILLTAFLAAVAAAPIFEEFLFRMILQGWLEAKLVQHNCSGAGGIAVVAVSFFFAAIHSGNSSLWNVHVLVLIFGLSITANLLILLWGIDHLIRRRGVSMRRYVFGAGRFFSLRFLTASGSCLLGLALIFGLAAALNTVLPETNVSPIPIFFFSLLSGTIYCKTKNLSYCILLHACLNGTSFTIAWLGAQ